MADSSGSALQAVEATIQKTASVLSGRSTAAMPSKGFQLLVRAIGEAKTKHEEDRIMRKESMLLKERMGARDTTTRQMKEYLVRLVYCEMLGVECGWGYIYPVKFTQSSNIGDKRIGYLASSLLLHENHELNMLLVNSIQRDLKSSNILEVSMALIIICKLIGAEMIPALLPLVREKMKHPKELVRKKALLAMHHFQLISPSSVSHLHDEFRSSLSDPDPGVMAAALILLHEIIKEDVSAHKDLVQAFTSILSQVVTRRLPVEYNYHSVPAPWVQLRLLRILALLGADNAMASGEMYSTLELTLGSAESNSNIGLAITYECIRTVTTIYPRADLIKKAAESVSRFLTAANNNWKYLGINSLAALVQVEPKIALDYQMTVMECLDDVDETLKRKTLDLLYKMTNPANVTVITDKLIDYLSSTNDEFMKADLVSKITQLAERFAPDNSWFIATMNAVFEQGGDLVRREVAHNLMRLIAEGTEDDDADHELRKGAVSSYIALLDKPHLPDILVKIICWVVGEYSYDLDGEVELEDVMEKVTVLLNWEFKDPQTQSWVINAITRLVAQLGYLPDYVHSQIALHLTSADTDVQQRCSELIELTQGLTLMQEVLPLDSACEDLEVDASLSFLDDFVSESLTRGASVYRPLSLRQEKTKISSPKLSSAQIKFEPYAQPINPTRHANFVTSQPEIMDQVSTTPPSTRAVVGTTIPAAAGDSGDNLKVDITTAAGGINVTGDRKWGRGGYRKVTGSVGGASGSPVSGQSTSTSTHDDRGGGGGGGTSSQTSGSIDASPASLSPIFQRKQKSDLVNPLFAGLSGAARPVKTKSRTPETHSTPRGGGGRGSVGGGKAVKGETTNFLLDLEDVQFSPPTTTHTESGSSGSATQPISVPASTSATLFDDLVLMGEGSTEAPTTSLPAVVPSVPLASGGERQISDTPKQSTDNNDLLGLFDGTAPVSLLTPSSSTSGPSTSSGLPSSSALALMDTPVVSQKLPDELDTLPVIPGWDKKELSSDSNVRLTATKLIGPDELVVVILLNNQKHNALTGVTMTIDPPSNLKVNSTTLTKTNTLTSTFTFTGDIDGFACVPNTIRLVPTSPSINMSLRGQVNYRDHLSTQQRMFFDLTIHVTDLIRPRKISTDEFGKSWGSLSYEKKLKINTSSVKQPSQFMEKMDKAFNFYPVQVIGTEAIAAGLFLPSTPCLVHGKITSSCMEFWVRSPSSLLTESLAKCAPAIFN